jgi:hypothetical protein
MTPQRFRTMLKGAPAGALEHLGLRGLSSQERSIEEREDQ